MSARDLLREPVWQGEELGLPMPVTTHAVSMALPRWQDVVGYEEKSPELLARLKSGYPRFVVHPLVQRVAEQLAQGQPCLPFPSRATAEACEDFVRRSTGEKAEIVSGPGVHGVVTTEAGQPALKAFWQHTGLIVSSRQAEAVLEWRKPSADADEVRRSLRQQLAEFYECGEDDIFLAPTGMAAQFAALRAVQQRCPGQPTAQLGFPYVDTLKLQQKLGHGGILLHHLDSIVAELESLLQRQSIAACFCEIPGNPLLGSANLRSIRPLLRQRGIPLVADDVVATPINVDFSHYADLIATSLTKYVAGTGDVMGGALVCNPKSPLYAELKPIVEAQHEELLWVEDAEVLATQARDFPERMRRHNENGLFIAERLRAHPAVEKVWYPKWEFSRVV